MKQFIIDGSDFDDEDGFRQYVHDILCPQLFKDASLRPGLNLDSFNDILRGGFGVFEHEEPIRLTWKNIEKSKADFGYDAAVKYYERIKLRAHPSNLEKIDSYIAEAKRHEGPTLFDLIVGIIKRHHHITFEEN